MPHLHAYARHDANAFAERLLQERFRELAPLAIEAWTSAEPLTFARRKEGAQRDLSVGASWGLLFDCAWFRFTGTVPAAAAGRTVVLLLDVNGELLVVDGVGNPVRGLTNQTSTYDYSLGKPGKRVLPFTDRAVGGEAVEIWADGGANDLFGFLKGEGRIAEARIAELRRTVQDLAYDVEVLGELATHLPDGPRKTRITEALSAIIRSWDGSDTAATAARAALAPLLADRGGDRPFCLSAIGHAHMDLAWLWPLRETRRKSARTLATVLANLETYPDYIFGISQPQQLAWIEQDHPDLFARVRAAIAAGRIECQGAMWVESDTNLVSGESLARQMLYGQRAWRHWFSLASRTCWLPDVFGYSAALPQILRQSGVEFFMTIKLSWSQVNRFPHHTFRWQSPDGSEVLAHMPPEGTYNSSARPGALLAAERGFLDAGTSDRGLMLFGIGDGGGGPGEEHLERIARTRDLAGLPTVEPEPSERFFARIDENRGDYAAWSGELYLEKHQGTFTSQGRLKRFNRQLEWALRRVEFALSRAWLAGAAWPQERLERIWKEVLLHQFHDILPGSSLGRVYREAEARSAELLAELATLTAGADALLPAGMQVVNDLAWERRRWIRAADGWREVRVAGLAATALPTAAAAITAPTVTATSLENAHLRARFAADGRLASLWDKDHQREVLAGPGNDLLCFDDPGDAWDLPLDYLRRRCERPILVATTTASDGPEAAIIQTWRIGASTITQRVVLATHGRRLEFRTTVDWQERGRMLRVRFPTAVHAEQARCEIAVGSIARPTHANTSWDSARFEVPAHAWVDLSERGYGVALLNDCKYGYRLDGDVLDLALLRSPSNPDPDGDRGAHAFTYAIFPHAGDHVGGGVLEEAHDLNQPLRLAQGHGGAATLAPLITIDQPGIVVMAIKKAEDSDHLVVRLAETTGASSRITLRAAPGIRAAHLANILEEHGEALAVVGGTASLVLPPWAIRTVMIASGT